MGFFGLFSKKNEPKLAIGQSVPLTVHEQILLDRLCKMKKVVLGDEISSVYEITDIREINAIISQLRRPDALTMHYKRVIAQRCGYGIDGVQNKVLMARFDHSTTNTIIWHEKVSFGEWFKKRPTLQKRSALEALHAVREATDGKFSGWRIHLEYGLMHSLNVFKYNETIEAKKYLLKYK